MKKHAPVLIAAAVALLVIAVVAGSRRKPEAEAPRRIAAPVQSERKPRNAHLVEIDWDGHEAYFPEPLRSDGDYWNIAYSDGSENWQSKRVSGRRDGRLFTGFPADTKEIHAWTGGASRPTYSVVFHRP